MDDPTPHSLSPAQAKQRLRAAAARASLPYWVRQRPWQALLASLATGYLAGRTRITPLLTTTIARQLVPAFIKHLLRDTSDHTQRPPRSE